MEGKELGETDVNEIRDRLSNCLDLGREIRTKVYQLHVPASKSEREKPLETKADSIGGEFKQCLSELTSTLDEALSTLQKFC